MPDKLRLVQEWLAKGGHDLEAVRLLLRAGGPADVVAFHLQQANEKYLKGYLISHGWRLKKTHNLIELVDKAAEYESSFGDYLDMAGRLTAYYIKSRYPSGPPADYPEEEIAEMLKQTEKLITKIREATK
ncbi:MAG: HEPN domain-containing protein [Chloroflexi bacterium]|nr:HEPN domain-containing protein [Chloroflexota bacterium]